MSLPTGHEIIAQACEEFGFSRAALLRPGQRGGKGKRDPRAVARDATMYRLRERGLSYPRIAALMGLKDHTSAMAAARRHAEANGLPIPVNKNCLPWTAGELATLETCLFARPEEIAIALPSRGVHAAVSRRWVLKRELGLPTPRYRSERRMAGASA